MYSPKQLGESNSSELTFFFFFKMDPEWSVSQSTLGLEDSNRVLEIITQGKAFVITYDWERVGYPC